MPATSHEIDAMEDLRVFVLSKAQGAYGIDTAKRYANKLMQGAIAAFERGQLDEAIRIAEREVAFDRKRLGYKHPYTQASIKCLKGLLFQRRIIRLEKANLLRTMSCDRWCNVTDQFDVAIV
jgi:hypothetical protein